MSRSGVYTDIQFAPSATPVEEVARKLLLVGEPIYYAEEKYLGVVEYTLGSFSILAGEDGTHPVIKPNSDDEFMAIEFFYKTAGSEVLTSLGALGVSALNFTWAEGEAIITLTSPLPVESDKLYVTIKTRVASIEHNYYTFKSVNDIAALLGDDSHHYPASRIAYNLNKALAIANQAVYAYFTAEDEFDTPATIVSALTRGDHYYIVPQIDESDFLTVGAYTTCLNAFIAHVKYMSTSEIKKERVLYATHPIVTPFPVGYAGENFIEYSALVSAKDGYALAATRPRYVDTYLVSIIGETRAWIGDDYVLGDTIATIIAAYRASKALGYSLTNENIVELTAIPSCLYYDEGDYSTLDDVGWYMLRQENLAGIPYVYHQRTAEQESPQVYEESTVVILHAYAKSCRQILKPLIAKGLFNRISTNSSDTVTARYLATLRTSLALLNKYYVDHEYLAAVGEPVLVQSEDRVDEVDIFLPVSIYDPVNKINVTINVVL